MTGPLDKRDPRHIRLHPALGIIAKHQRRFYLVPYGIERANMYTPRVGEQVYVDELRGSSSSLGWTVRLKR